MGSRKWVHDEIEFGRLFDWDIAGLGPAQLRVVGGAMAKRRSPWMA
jgi:hypothetical protein